MMRRVCSVACNDPCTRLMTWITKSSNTVGPQGPCFNSEVIASAHSLDTFMCMIWALMLSACACFRSSTSRPSSSIDRKNANDFLKWESLRLDTFEVGVNPTRLSIEQVSLADFFARVIVDADGSVNLVSMFGGTEKPEADTESADGPSQAQPAEKPAEAGQPPSVRIARVMLSGGDVDFSDRFIKYSLFHDLWFHGRFHALGNRCGLIFFRSNLTFCLNSICTFPGFC